ncbi:YifB family Mg chelatase-like AAA ATPase [Helicobacter sp. MIT 14-3879]|uniref:YifB family Mg chelatase-like AAA ATPase n=1 Tax=Helicobacter sp. MIT 14-3879 TaxID=2040649 RepID=UPI000E1E30EF|nr:YifB family Mg chelatase-like AAA ATPase [Helicobacter sp. MIT 14-3879]RDU65033.1 Fis family transcriptional regulator [Helicobacter sp. MIT 14-3879]
MVKKLLCATRFGIGAKIIQVESSFSKGLPSFVITGLAGNSIQEAKQRISGALANNNFQSLNFKITINLSPSDLSKNGSHFDLPIALLIALQKQELDLTNWFVFGELGLDGYIKDTNSIYPLLLEISKTHKKSNVLLPKEGEKLYSNIPNLQIYYASNLLEAIEILKNPTNMAKCYDFSFKSIEINSKKYYYEENFLFDFYDIKGQSFAKRAALIAVAGMHNIVFEGSPGCGKSMIAKRMRYIMPPISFEEMCECASINALNNNDGEYCALRPFRNPHQSSSKSAILGSVFQSDAKPGEISLSHNGILFFDELLNFHKSILESLREPLENNELSISRVNIKVTYPTCILFVGAMNPCPCGNLYSSSKECRCNEIEIRKYRNKLSEPLRDRIDIFIKMEENRSEERISSIELFKQVLDAFSMQKSRNQGKLNGKLNDSEIEKFCALNEENLNLLELAVQRYGLSFRGRQKILKVARSIADLNKSENIKKEHLLESLSYRII